MKKLIFVMLASVLSHSAQALIEVRAGYHLQQGDPKDYNSFVNDSCSGCGTKVSQIGGLGFDIMAKIPLIPIGFGIRSDTLQQSLDYSGVAKLTQTFMATSLVLNYRIIDTLAYIGPIVAYGISNKSTLKSEILGTEVYSGTAGKASSYTAGVEGGFKLGLMRLGAEVGYGNYLADEITNSADQVLSSGSTTAEKIDFTGSYVRIQLGVGF